MPGPFDLRLAEGPVTLRPLRHRDYAAWSELRVRNAAWLAPWESTLPGPDDERPPSFSAMVRRMRSEARAGRGITFAILVDGALRGQITLGGISWGSLRSGYVGYWVGLHRVEINIRPENVPSLRVVEKLGFRPEGTRLRYLHIDGEWRDHLSFALNAEEVPGGLVQRWRTSELNRSREVR